MASPFAAALAAADAAIDGQMGESVQVTPMRDGDFDAAPDPERPAFDCVALVSFADPAPAPIAKMDIKFMAEEYTVEIRREVLAGRRIAKGDELILLEQPGSPRVRVVRPPSRLDPGRIALTCAPTAS